MVVWLTLPFYDFCGFWSVAVNSVYKLQCFYIYEAYIQDEVEQDFCIAAPSCPDFYISLSS